MKRKESKVTPKATRKVAPKVTRKVTPKVPPNVTPKEIPTESMVDKLVKMRISELAEEAKARALRSRSTTLNVESTRILARVGLAHACGSFFPYAAVHEGDGSLFVVPTDEKDPDKVRVHWLEGGHVASFSLNKIWRLKKFTIPKGHALVMDCAPAQRPDVGDALEIRYASGRLEAIEHVSPKQAG